MVTGSFVLLSTNSGLKYIYILSIYNMCEYINIGLCLYVYCSVWEGERGKEAGFESPYVPARVL